MDDKVEGVPRTIAKEVAEKEFADFVDAWDIDANTDAMSGEDREAFAQQKAKIVTQIMKGSASIDEDGNISYRLKKPQDGVTEIVFRIPSGQAYMAMDQYKDRQNVHKMYAFMGSMTKQETKLFSRMDARDTKFCMGVTLLFLGS